jgi:hypothetical protein
MTAEGYDYEYALTMISHDAGDYGTYSSTPTTSRIEVTVDPPLDVRLMSQGKGRAYRVSLWQAMGMIGREQTSTR